MSKEIDEKVVELRFNNSNFEKNARATMSTIEKLEEKLNFKGATKGLQNVDKAASSIKFTVLSDAVDKVSVKFNALQVAAFTCFQNITNKAISTGEQLIKSLTIDQISEGYTKYEQKTAAVQTIMNATGKSIEEVTASLEKLNWFTDETSYNFIDMVNNIGKFTSAGVDLDVAVTAMEGIANEAAISGQGIQEASRAMYNFAQAIGAGAVKLIDWKSIENANMATQEFKENIIDVALQEGTLKKVGDKIVTISKGTEVSITDFNSALSEGWFTSDVLIKTLQRYGEYADKVFDVVQEKGVLCAEAMEMVSTDTQTLGERAFKAAQEAKTFTDAINATKDAVSTGWMTTFETLFGNYIEAKETWTRLANQLYDIFAESGNVRNELLATAMAAPLDNFKNKISEAGVDVEDFENKLIELARESGIYIDQLIGRWGSLDKVLVKTHIPELIELMPQALRSLADDAGNAAVSTEDLNAKLDEYNDLVYRIAVKGEFGNGQTRFTALEQMGYDWREIQSYVNRFIESGGQAKVTIDDLSDSELKNIGYTDDEIEKLRALADEAEETGSELNELMNTLDKPSGRTLLVESLFNILNALQHVLETVKEAWSEIFPPLTTERIYNLIERFHTFTENLMLNEERTDQLKRTFKGLFAVLDVVRIVITSLVQNGFNLIGRIFDAAGIDVLEFTATIGDNLVGIRNWIAEGDKLGTVFGWVADRIVELVTALRNWGTNIINSDAVVDFITGIYDNFEKYFPGLNSWLEGLGESFEVFTSKIKDLDGISLDNIVATVKAFKDTVIEYISGINAEDVQSAFDELGKVISSFFTTAGKAIWQFVQDMGSALAETVSAINPLSIILILAGASFLLLGERLKASIDSLIETLAPVEFFIKKMTKALAGFINEGAKALKRVSKAFAFDLVASGILTISVAIALLSASLIALSKVDHDKIDSVIASMSLLLGAIALFTIVVAKSIAAMPGILAIAALMTTLAISISILTTTIKTFDDLEHPFITMFSFLGTIAGSAGILTGAIIIIGKFAKSTASFSISLIAFAASVSLVAISLGVLSNLDLSGTFGKLLEVGVAIAMIFGLSKLAETDNGSNALALIGFVVGINLLIYTIASLKYRDMKLVLTYLPTILSILVVMSIAIGITKNASEYVGQAGAALLAMSLSILVLLQAVKMIANFEWETIGKAIVVIDDLFAMFALVIGLSKLAGEHALKAGGMILMMTLAVNSLAIVLWGLSLLDPKGLIIATVVIDSILIIFTVLVANTKKIKDAYQSIKAIGFAIGLLMLELGVLLLFSNGNDVLKAAVGISAIIIALSIAFNEMSGLKARFKDLKGITGNLTLLLAAVVGALVILGGLDIDTNGLITKAAAVSIIMISLGVTMKLMEKIQNQLKGWKDFGVIASFVGAMTVVIFALIGALALISKIQITDFVSFGTILGSISLLLIELSGLTVLLFNFTYNLTGLYSFKDVGVILGLIGGLAAIVGVLAIVLSSLDGVTIKIETAGSLTILIMALSVMTIALINLTYNLTDLYSFKDIGIILGFIAGLGAIAAGLGWVLNQLKPMPLDETLPKVLSMSAFIAGLALVGMLVVKLGEMIDDATLTVALKGLAGVAAIFVAMQVLMFALGAIDDGTEGLFSQKANRGLAVIGEQIGSFIGGIAKGFAGESEDSVIKMANALKEACEVLAQIKPEAIEIMVRLLESISTTAAALAVSDIFGEGDWETISNGLVEFGNSLGKYADSVSELTDEKIDAIYRSIEPTEALIEVLNQIPPVGGFKQKFAGHVSWTTIGQGLAEYGAALCSFAAMVSGVAPYDSIWTDGSGGTKSFAIDEAASKYIKTAVNATSSLIDLLNAIPPVGGFVDKFVGTIEWDTISIGLVDYAEALCGFSALVSGSVEGYPAPDKTAIMNAIDCSKALLEVLDAIPTPDSSFFDKLFFDDAGTVPMWSTLSNGLDAYGWALANFGKAVESLGNTSILTAINTAVSVSERLVDMMKAVYEIEHAYMIDANLTGGIWSRFTNNLNGDTQNPGLSVALQIFAVNTSNINKTQFSNVGSAINDLMEPFRDNSSFKPELMSSFNTQIIAIGQTIKDLTGTEFKSAGQAVVNGFVIGIQDNSRNAINAVYHMGNDVAEALKYRLGISSPSKVSKEDAMWFVQGFVNGIVKNEYKATRIATELATGIVESFNDRMGIHSASTEMKDSAGWTLQGFIDGIKNGWGDITNTMKQLATSVVDNFDISKIKEMGGDLIAVLSGDFSSLTDMFSKDDYTKQMEEYTKQLEEMTAAGLEDTDAFKELQNEMNEFKSQNSGAYNYVLSEELKEAESLYDKILDDFKKGKITAGEFDKQYTDLLKNYSDQAGELITYHKDQISDYISGSLEEIQSEFENKIKDINSKMNSLKDNLSKSYDDTLIYTTNQDIYNKKVSEYETQISKLNRELTETQKRYGENSSQAKQLQEQLRLVNEELESYKAFYETQGFDDNEIVDISWSDELNKETDALFNYADAIEQMVNKRGKDLTDPLIEYLGTLDKEKGKKTVDWLNSLSDEEFARMSAELQANAEAARRVAEMLYKPQMEAATEQFDTAVTDLRDKLPSTAVSIGADIAKGLTNGFSEEVEDSLERIGTSGDKLLDTLKERFGIHSPSTVAKEEIGYNLADGIIGGTIERLLTSSAKMADAVKEFVYNAFAPMMFDEEGNNPIATEFSKVIASINEALLSGIDTEPVIRPVLDLSNVYTGVGELNSMFGYESANQINGYMNSAREIQNRPLVTAPVERGGTTNYFTQNNYSPKSLSRAEIARDTTRIMQLATQART